MSRSSPVTGFPSNVLVVDDDPAMLSLFRHALDQRGLACRMVTSGEEAIELLQESGFGCLLVDERLPGVSGLEVIATARRAQPYCACIVMTAYPSPSSVVEALRLGAIDYLEKPFDDLELVLQQIDHAIVNQRNAYELGLTRDRFHNLQKELHSQTEAAGQLQRALAETNRLAADLADRATRLVAAIQGQPLTDQVAAPLDDVLEAVASVQTQVLVVQYSLPVVE